jgi:taurine transport system permease protein
MKKETLINILGPVLFLATWHCVLFFGKIDPYYIPGPIDIVNTFMFKIYSAAPDGSTLMQHTLASVLTSLTGFVFAVLVGVPLGLFMGWQEKIDKSVRPLFDVFRQIPTPAWIPFSILWFGIGYFQRGFIVWSSAFIPVVINSYYGIRNVPEIYVNLSRVFGFSEWEIFRKVYVPASLPQTFTGIVIGYGVSWFVLVAAEFMAASQGLGYMIWMASRLGRSDLIVLGMLLIGLIGAILTSLIKRIEDVVVKYQA